MTDERKKIARGNVAEKLLSDPLIVEAYDKAEFDLIDELLLTDPGDDELRWRLVCKINALRDVRQEMTNLASNAKQLFQRRRNRDE